MGKKQLTLLFFTALLSYKLSAKEIVVGVDFIPKRQWALMFTPAVIPDLFSAKMALEYRLYDKLNLIIPLEAKWMDYRWAIRLAAQLGGAKPGLPERLYRPENKVIPQWNIDFSQLKISSGLGLKYFPFSESMSNAFYLKTLLLLGGERFYAYTAEGESYSALLTPVLTLGYSWVAANRFTYGFEAGAEYIYHTHPIKNLPILIDGLNPIVQFNLGFTI